MVALALKEAGGVLPANCGSFYSVHPKLYHSQHKAGARMWVQWPLSQTPVAFDQIKNAAQYRRFYCYFYDGGGALRQPVPYSAVFHNRDMCANGEWGMDRFIYR